MAPAAEGDEPSWARGSGTEESEGICLSGGGLRAASFSLGVLQVLQEQRQLLFGESAAEYLAAVSGGSYIAGTHVLGGRERARSLGTYESLAPLAPGSPEEEYVLSHGRYLRNPLALIGLMGLNLVALAVLFAWIGMFVALAASLWPALPPGAEDVLIDLYDLPLAAHTLALLASLALLVRGLYSESPWRRAALALLGILLLLVSSRPVVAEATGWESFGSIADVTRTVGPLFAALLLFLGLAQIVKRIGITGLPASVFNVGAAVAVRGIGGVLVLAVAAAWFPELAPTLKDGYPGESGDVAVFLAFVATLGLGFFFSYVPHRASLHREYRSRLQSCFSVVRGPEATAARVGQVPLSDTAPPENGTARYPRLVVCATANVSVKRDGRRWTFVPYLLSHDACGAPAYAESWLPTKKLELGEEPAGVFTGRKERLLSLFTAVAATGAAVSPSMGRMTVPSARPVIAALNIRLGRWIPNPFSARARKAVLTRSEAGRFDDTERLGRGYDELVPEMFGLSGPRAYISDGGHYDNLGLLALLRARCAVIWCVDASPDPEGKAKELERVLEVSKQELKIPVEIDLRGFRRQADGLYRATHAIGRIDYGTSNGRLIVVKLGLSPKSAPALRGRKGRFGFPHHPTWRQIYSRERMTAYRDLGQENAALCLQQETGVPVAS